MPRLQATNNGQTVLAETITDAQASFSVADASTFPDQGPFRIIIDAEVMEVGTINKVTNTFSDVQRGMEGSFAASHDEGTKVVHRFTAGAYEELADLGELAGGNIPISAEVISSFPPDAADGRIVYDENQERFFGRAGGKWK